MAGHLKAMPLGGKPITESNLILRAARAKTRRYARPLIIVQWWLAGHIWNILSRNQSKSCFVYILRISRISRRSVIV